MTLFGPMCTVLNKMWNVACKPLHLNYGLAHVYYTKTCHSRLWHCRGDAQSNTQEMVWTFRATGLYLPHEHFLLPEHRRLEREKQPTSNGMSWEGEKKIKPLVELAVVPPRPSTVSQTVLTESASVEDIGKWAVDREEITRSCQCYATLTLRGLRFWTVCGATKTSKTKMACTMFCFLVMIKLHSQTSVRMEYV